MDTIATSASMQQLLDFLKNLVTQSYGAMLTLPSEIKTIMVIALAIAVAGGLAKGAVKLVQVGVTAFIIYAVLVALHVI